MINAAFHSGFQWLASNIYSVWKGLDVRPQFYRKNGINPAALTSCDRGRNLKIGKGSLS